MQGIKHTQVAAHFSKAAIRYQQYAQVQVKIAHDLLQTKIPTKHSVQCLLDLGAGTGLQLPKLLQYVQPDGCCIALDCALGMSKKAQQYSRRDTRCSAICAAAQALPLESQSIDRIFSNLMLQWIAAPIKALNECARVLKPGAAFQISTCIQGTFHELQQLQTAALGYSTVNHFFSAEQYLDCFQQVGLQCLEVQQKTYRSWYPSVQAVLRSILNTGTGYSAQPKRPTLSIKQLNFEYHKQFSQNNRIPLTHKVLLISGIAQ